MIRAKGIAAFAAKQPLGPYAFERRDPRPNDVVIDIKYCGICHSDVHQARDEWGGSQFPMVPGHEIAGVVTAVGTAVTKHKVGDRVGVGCLVDSCRTCESCERTLEQYCLKGANFTYNGLEKDGKTVTQGGYSNVIVVDENYTLRIPDALPLDKAAPLLCAGVTLYSPLKHWKAGPGKRVGIMGLGGLGHMGVKIGVAMGAEVTVISRNDSKKQDALGMGAHHFLATDTPDALKAHAGTFDLIINTVSADIDMGPYFQLLKLDAALVVVGVPEKPLSIHPFPLIGMRRSYAGSLIGSIRETQDMLDFCAAKNITPDIETIAPEGINAAYDRVVKSDVRYRFVVDMGKL